MPRHKFDRSLLPENPDLTFEQRLWGMGVRFVAGVDEAGRGALAGPVAAGAVVLPWEDDCLIEKLDGVRDSKVMTAEARTHWAEVIKRTALAWDVGFASAQEIDRMGILPATRLAAVKALANLDLSVDHVLIDYLILPEIEIPQTPLVKGDARSLSIACASVLAKTARDAVLVEMEKTYPGYGFASHKGYATEAHRKAIAALRPCEQHRCTFSPVSDYYSLFPPESSCS